MQIVDLGQAALGLGLFTISCAALGFWIGYLCGKADAKVGESNAG